LIYFKISTHNLAELGIYNWINNICRKTKESTIFINGGKLNFMNKSSTHFLKRLQLTVYNIQSPQASTECRAQHNSGGNQKMARSNLNVKSGLKSANQTPTPTNTRLTTPSLSVSQIETPNENLNQTQNLNAHAQTHPKSGQVTPGAVGENLAHSLSNKSQSSTNTVMSHSKDSQLCAQGHGNIKNLQSSNSGTGSSPIVSSDPSGRSHLATPADFFRKPHFFEPEILSRSDFSIVRWEQLIKDLNSLCLKIVRYRSEESYCLYHVGLASNVWILVYEKPGQEKVVVYGKLKQVLCPRIGLGNADRFARDRASSSLVAENGSVLEGPVTQ